MQADYVILKYNKLLFINRFGVERVSLNISKDDVDELIRLFKRDVEKEFESYSYFKLQSGKYCFARAYSKDGNNSDYKVECIVLEDIDFYPHQFIGCDINFNDYAEIKIKEVNVHVLAEFARTNNEIYEVISKIIIKENIVIVDENYLNWLNSIYLAFPKKQAKEIFFTTDINLKLNFNIKIFNEYDQKNNVFNFKLGIKPSCEKVFEFTKIIEMGYLLNYNHIQSFHSFLDEFGIKKIDADIDKLYWIYKILDVELKDIDRQTFVEIIQFATASLAEEHLVEIFKKIEPNFEVLIAKFQIGDLGIVVDFVKKVYKKNSSFINRCTEILNALFDDMALKTEDIKAVIDIFENLLEEIRGNSLTLARSQIREERINYFIAILNSNPKANTAYYFTSIILNSLIEFEYTFNQTIKIENMKSFLDLGINILMEEFALIKDILKTASKNVGILANMVFVIFDKIDSFEKEEIFIQYLISTIDNYDEYKRFELRKQVYSVNKRILYHEFRIRIKQVEDKRKFFEEYSRDVFDKFDDYYKEYFDRVLKDYLLSISEEEVFDEVLKIINKVINEKILLSDDAAKILISCLEKGFDFDYKDELKEILKWIKLIKKIRRIETNNDILSLIDLGIFLEDNKDKKLFIDDIFKGKIKASILSGKKYINFINWTFYNIIHHIADVDDHKKVVYFYNPEDDLSFYKFYLENVIKLIDENSEKGYNVLLTFLVYFYFYVEPKYRLYGEEDKTEEFNKFLIEKLSLQRGLYIKKFNEDLEKEFFNNGLSVPIMWQQVYQRITKE